MPRTEREVRLRSGFVSAWVAGVRLGPYVLVSPIATGGMGEVWKAHDDRLNRSVAIKRLMHPDHARFAQEAQDIAALTGVSCIERKHRATAQVWLPPWVPWNGLWMGERHKH